MREMRWFLNKEELCTYLRELYSHLPHNFDISPIGLKVTKYGEGIDERTGWDTHILTLANDYGVLGYVDRSIDNLLTRPEFNQRLKDPECNNRLENLSSGINATVQKLVDASHVDLYSK